MAPGGKTYARLKNASKPIGSSSEDEEDELSSRKKMPLPTMKAPMAKGNAAAPSSSSVSVRNPTRRAPSSRKAVAQ
ncbi:hypothetical protein niasHT_037582 [Heterodera trifolii]|uniref:Uncharacterized protein n=1 Tax=Heterodera trifolii TaxID=157864 RepID=A0ABD2I9T3_9BILA